MDVTSPTKPPRGVKTSKENSGLLMAVIRTLSNSESNEQRDRERLKLEREYKKCDQKLDELVSIHKQDLERVMQLFTQMSTTVTSTRDKLKGIKETLIACKTLLSCRRDELKKLWCEGVEHKHVLQLLDEIEQLKEVPSKLAHHLANKDYLIGTRILVSALNAGEGELDGVEALRELRAELQGKKEKLYDIILKEMNSIIYVAPLQGLNLSPQEEAASEKIRWRQKIVDPSTLSCSITNNQDANFEQELRMLVECVGLLNKLSDSVNTMKTHMQSEILKVINIVSRNLVLGSCRVHPLLKFVEVLIEQLKKISVRFRFLLVAYSEVAKSYKMALPALQTSDIWATIQAVLQLVLTDYLDIQNVSSEAPANTGLPDQSADISTFFARRRIQRTRKFPLFKFEYSSNVNFLSKDQQSLPLLENKQRGKVLICSPNPFNITIVYRTLLKFVEEIESFLSLPPGVPCTLRVFINDYVKDVFIGREHSKILLKVEGATKSMNAWRTPVSLVEAASMGLIKPILQSTYHVSEAINELELLLDSLPKHRHEILDILVNLVKNFVETCNAAYRGIIQPEPEDKRLCSAAWLKDEDISRFLKSLPNWVDLQSQKNCYSTPHSGRALRKEDTTEEESPEDVRQRNMKEAEILASNLGEGGIGAHEIISDPQQLKCLAQLQESMEWFSLRVSNINISIKKRLQESSETNSLTKYTSTLSSLSDEFEDLANTCLLVLHLEIRVQCFHYLLPAMGRKSKDNSSDPDPRVLDLSRVLVSVDEALSPSLQQRKCKYIFEGLGHLIAKILMSSTQYLERIDEIAVEKMCRNIFALQQTLSNITMSREVALDHARRYFQLFFMTPDDILNQVLEKGPEFSELEYINALQLINRTYKKQDDPNASQKYLQRLSDILAEVGVTV